MPFTEKQFNGIMKLLEKAGFFFQALYMLLYLCFHAWNNVPYTLPDLVITVKPSLQTQLLLKVS